MEGTGFLGQAADDVYRIEGEDLYLVGTSEVPMAAFHSDEILDAASLPLRYAAFSPCFRKEAGSHGKDTRGIWRVHWFDKVEMFVYTTLEESYAEHQRLLAWEKEFLDKLELCYRVIDTAAGDLGLSAARKFDCEAWIPTRNGWGELTSTSNCTEFQARRLDIRTRVDGSTTPVATLNGTLTAVTRAIVAILETHQNEDGSVTVPQALRPYLGGPRGAEADLRWLSWQPKVVALDIDGTLLKWVDGQTEDYETITDAGLRRGAPRPRRRRPHRAVERPLAARHDPDRRPARTSRARAPTGSGWSRPTARWCSATRRWRSSTRRPSTPPRRSPRCWSTTPTPWSRSRSAASAATASTGSSPRASSPASSSSPRSTTSSASRSAA